MFTFCPPKKLPNLKSTTSSDGKRFYTLPDGSTLPSVTTVLAATPNYDIEKWKQRVGLEEAQRISKKATIRGTYLHTLCEDYLNNKPLTPMMPHIMEMFYGLRPQLNHINNIHYQECSLWSKTLGMAGRVDCIGEYKGNLSVIDFKTSKRLKDKNDILSYFCQTTAYALMYKELVGINIDQLVIMIAVDNEKPQIFIEKPRNYVESLVKYVKTYRQSVKEQV